MTDWETEQLGTPTPTGLTLFLLAFGAGLLGGVLIVVAGAGLSH